MNEFALILIDMGWFLYRFEQKCVTALEQTWHPDHFFCTQCGCQFGEEGFQEKDGKPYCKNDYLSLFALKCKGCSMAITEGYISALSAQWHADCFVCRVSSLFSAATWYLSGILAIFVCLFVFNLFFSLQIALL